MTNPVVVSDGGPYSFDRYVDGVLMAEGVTIERKSSLPDAIREAVRICPKSPGKTVLVLSAFTELRGLREVLNDLVAADQAIVAWTKGNGTTEELTALEDQLGEAIRACTRARALTKESTAK